MSVRLLLSLAFAATIGVPVVAQDPHPVKVHVVVIHATTANNKIDNELKNLAKEIQKTRPDLTGFSMAEALHQKLAVGKTGKFTVAKNEELTVKVDKGKCKENKIGLTVAPPGAGEITYSCTCDKYVPIMTGVKLQGGQTVIVGVMAKPCEEKK